MTVKTEPGLQISSRDMKKAAENAAFFFWLQKRTPGSAGGEKKGYGEGRSRQEKVSELE